MHDGRRMVHFMKFPQKRIFMLIYVYCVSNKVDQENGEEDIGTFQRPYQFGCKRWALTAETHQQRRTFLKDYRGEGCRQYSLGKKHSEGLVKEKVTDIKPSRRMTPDLFRKKKTQEVAQNAGVRVSLSGEGLRKDEQRE